MYGYLSFMARRRQWGPLEQVLVPVTSVRIRPGAFEFKGSRVGSSYLEATDAPISLLDPDGAMVRQGGERSKISMVIKDGDDLDLTFTLEVGITG